MEPAGQFRLTLGQVERQAVRLREHRNHEQHECQRLRKDVPVDQAAPLPLDDVVEVQRTRQEKDPDDRQRHRDLVADHLRRGADAPEQRPLRVRGPARQRDAIDADRGDREHVEHAHVRVRDGNRDLAHRPRRTQRRGGDAQEAPNRKERIPPDDRADRHDAQRQERGGRHHRRRDQVQEPVRPGRDDLLLEEQLDAIQEAVKEPPGPGAVRAGAVLRPGDELALVEDDERQDAEDAREDRQNLDEGEDQDQGVPGAANDVAEGIEEGLHQRSGRASVCPRRGGIAKVFTS